MEIFIEDDKLYTKKNYKYLKIRLVLKYDIGMLYILKQTNI